MMVSRSKAAPEEPEVRSGHRKLFFLFLTGRETFDLAHSPSGGVIRQRLRQKIV